MKINIKKVIFIAAGIATVFLIGRVSKNQNAGLTENKEIKETGEIEEIEKQRNKEMREIKEIEENREIGNQKSEIEENEETEKQRNEEMGETGEIKEIEENLFLVTRVVDGDTVELENGQKVRYIGVDTPESVDPRKPVQCFGKEASVKNEELVLNKRVRLEKDVSETDKYGRLLRYVYVGDTFINLELVKQGYASAATFPPDVNYSGVFKEAEKEARENGRGLWGKCK